MNIFLHIGWHKTGTTAIQQFLLRNRNELCKRLGVNYPVAGLYKVAHNLPAWALQLPHRAQLLKDVGCVRDADTIFRDMLEETTRQGLTSLLISSEEFSPIHFYSLGRLAKILEGHQVVIVAYVRRQDEYIESRYSQMVKFRKVRLAKEFATFVDGKINDERLNYFRYFRRWADIFGRSNLRVRTYNRGNFRDGDVRRDFCDVIGLKDEGLAFDADDTNKSLDFDSVCFLSRFNAVPLTEKQHDDVVRALREFALANPRLSYGLLDPEERSRIVARFSDSNKEFAREFLGKQDAFDPVDVTDTGARNRFDEKRFMEMLSFVVPRLLQVNVELSPSKQGPHGRRISA